MAEKNITDALKKLDPKNDDHWTSDKKPAVAAVSELHGESVSRDDIDGAAEGFTRDTAPGFFMTTGSKQADGSKKDVKAGTDAEGKLDVPGTSTKADGSEEPSADAPTGTTTDEDGRTVNQDARLPDTDISQGSERIDDGRQAASTAENPRAVDATQGEDVAAVEQASKPWENVVKSGTDRPVPVDSPEGQKTVNDPRADANGRAQKIDPSVTDDLPGLNAEGDVSGVRIPPVTYDPIDRAEVVTPGNDGDNVDVNDKPSGIPTTVSEGDFNLHAAPFNPAHAPRSQSGSEIASSREAGATEDDDTSESGAGGPAGNGEAEQSEVASANDRADEVASLEEELRSREKNIAQLRMKADEANKEWREAEQDADVIRTKIAQLRPTDGSTRTVKNYLESRKKQLDERGQRQQALKDAGVNLADVLKGVQKSPIDQAMSRKTGRGGQRPSRV